MKTISFLTSLFLILSTTFVSAAQLIHRSVIDGLVDYNYLSPVISLDSTYYGFVATDYINDKVDVYDSSGALSYSIGLTNNLRMAIGRLSQNTDTLIIYALEDTAYTWNHYYINYDVLRITKITLTGDNISFETMAPECNSTYGNEPPGINAKLKFGYNDEHEPTSVVFQASLTISLWELTMGTRTSVVNTYNKYNLDLSESLIRSGCIDLVTCFFGGSDTCGSAMISNYYERVIDDPWNSGTWSGTRLSIYNCGVSLAARHTKSGRSYYLFRGNFIPGTINDEIIYVGSAEDLLGLRDGLQTHWVCYSVANDTVTEEWWMPPPWKFQPHFYLNHSNAIIGIVNGISVNLLDCETGAYKESFPLDHIMYFKSFLITSGQAIPNIFGRLGDTVFVFDLCTPTIIVSHDENTIPNSFVLFQNYPNPFNQTTMIGFSLFKVSDVKLDVYNTLGREVASLANGRYPAGHYSVDWDGKDDNGKTVASGLYLYKMETGEYSETKKMILLK